MDDSLGVSCRWQIQISLATSSLPCRQSTSQAKWARQKRPHDSGDIEDGLQVSPGLSIHLVLWDWLPGAIRIETFHFCELFESGWAKILFVDNAVMAHDEALHSGHRVFGRRCH